MSALARVAEAIAPGWASRRRNKNVASLVFDTPLLLEPRKAALIARYVAARMVGGPAPAYAVDVDGAQRRDRQRLVIDRGVAVIDISGVLVHRHGQMDADSAPLLSYEEVSRELDAAVRSDEVRRILLRIDSGGGECSGAFDLADRIYAARQQKPVWAVVADFGCSAAYLLASAASRVVTTQSATLGSIGVVLTRLDITKALEAEGVQVIEIAQGARKLDGSPTEPWKDGSEEDKALRAYTESFYDLFVNAVARYRVLTPAAVRATDAAVYVGVDSVAIGLADSVGTLDGALADLESSTARPGGPRLAGTLTLEGTTMLSKEQLATAYPQFVAEWLEEGRRMGGAAPAATAETERARVLAVQQLGGKPAIVAESIANGRSLGDHAIAVLTAERGVRHAFMDGLRGDETELVGVMPSPLVGAEDEHAEAALAARIVARHAQANPEPYRRTPQPALAAALGEEEDS